MRVTESCFWVTAVPALSTPFIHAVARASKKTERNPKETTELLGAVSCLPANECLTNVVGEGGRILFCNLFSLYPKSEDVEQANPHLFRLPWQVFVTLPMKKNKELDIINLGQFATPCWGARGFPEHRPYLPREPPISVTSSLLKNLLFSSNLHAWPEHPKGQRVETSKNLWSFPPHQANAFTLLSLPPAAPNPSLQHDLLVKLKFLWNKARKGVIAKQLLFSSLFRDQGTEEAGSLAWKVLAALGVSSDCPDRMCWIFCMPFHGYPPPFSPLLCALGGWLHGLHLPETLRTSSWVLLMGGISLRGWKEKEVGYLLPCWAMVISLYQRAQLLSGSIFLPIQLC